MYTYIYYFTIKMRTQEELDNDQCHVVHVHYTCTKRSPGNVILTKFSNEYSEDPKGITK